MSPIRTLIVDDHADFRARLSKVLKNEAAIAVVGEAEDGEQAIQMAEELKPDLILMDLRMPRMNGLTAIKKIKAMNDGPEIIVLTAYDLPQYREEAKNIEASAFIVKRNLVRELMPAIRKLYNLERKRSGNKS